MNDDGSAKELENLLRDALNHGLESPRGGAPIAQLRTAPLDVQKLPTPPTPPTRATSQSRDEPPRGSVPGLAERLAPESSPKAIAKAPHGKTLKAGRRAARTSLYALVGIGAFALAAASGAAWLAHERPDQPVATATMPSTSQQGENASAEGAVGIAVTSRTAHAAPASTGAETKPEPAKADEARPVAPRPAAPPAPTVMRPEPRPAAKPAPRAVTPPAPVAAKPEARPTEKSPSAEKAPAPPSPPAGGVDALLQQQLKGAF